MPETPKLISAITPGRASRSSIWGFVAASGAFVVGFGGILPLVQLPGAQGVLFLIVSGSVWGAASLLLLTHAIIRLELTTAELCWYTPIRRRAAPLVQVIAVRWQTLGPPRPQGSSPSWNVEIEVCDRKPLRFAADVAMIAFADEMKAIAPHIKLRFPPAISWRRAGYQGPIRKSWL